MRPRVDDRPCPFKIGHMVFYRPSQRGIAQSVNDTPGSNPKIAEAVRIVEISADRLFGG
jgi:hypothetical protein